MILKIGHIARTSTALERDLSELSGRGYSLDFCVRNIPNITAKRTFIAPGVHEHSLAVLHHDNAPSMEIVAYDKLRMGQGYLTPGKSPWHWNAATCDMQKSLSFWSQLGFDQCNDILVRKGPLDQQAFSITLQPGSPPQHPALDVAGFVCIALITSRLKRHRQQLADAGFYVTEIEPLKLNDQVLRICFAASGAGEIVELIEFDQVASKGSP